MKAFLFTSVLAVFLLTGCKDASDSTAHNTSNGNIGEATLPKGKYIMEEDDAIMKRAGVNEPKKISGLGDNPVDQNPNTTILSDPKLVKQLDLKRRYKNLLVFHADDTMKIKKSYIATLVLGKDQKLGDLKIEALESSNSKKDDIKVDTTLEIGTTMSAKLTDLGSATDKGFDIEYISAGSGEQIITEKHPKVTWSWKLTPQSPGEQNLLLTVAVKENDGATINLPTRNIPVIIFAEKESIWAMIGNFFSDPNGKWLFTAILIPILIAWFTTRMKHKHEAASRLAHAQQDANAAHGNAAQPNTAALNTSFRKNANRRSR